MVVTVKHDIELSEWEVISEGEQLELIHLDYQGFTVVRYKENAYFLNKGYFVELPALVSNL
jgi:hypothetical protein